MLDKGIPEEFEGTPQPQSSRKKQSSSCWRCRYYLNGRSKPRQMAPWHRGRTLPQARRSRTEREATAGKSFLERAVQ